jgi:recombination endonuclease VII
MTSSSERAFGLVDPVGVYPGPVGPHPTPRVYPTPEAPHCPNSHRPGWLLSKFHCPQDKELQRTYGITCEQYWVLFEDQQGLCGPCGKPPRARRLVVDHDPDTGDIGLAHFGCNRSLDIRKRRYVKDPPGRRLGLKVPADRLRKIERRRRQKREAASRAKPQPTPDVAGMSAYAAKVAAARRATERK